MTRSNYFAVKDVPSFRRFCDRWGMDVITNKGGLYGFLYNESEYFWSHEGYKEYMHGWRTACDDDDHDHDPDDPASGEDEDEDEDENDDEPIEPHPEASFDEQLAALLASGNVAIVIELDNDHMRFLVGHAWAVNSRYEKRELSLDDIYKIAEDLGENITRAED